jgi:hypothetical protein
VRRVLDGPIKAYRHTRYNCQVRLRQYKKRGTAYLAPIVMRLETVVSMSITVKLIIGLYPVLHAASLRQQIANERCFETDMVCLPVHCLQGERRP